MKLGISWTSLYLLLAWTLRDKIGTIRQFGVYTMEKGHLPGSRNILSKDERRERGKPTATEVCIFIFLNSMWV